MSALNSCDSIGAALPYSDVSRLLPVELWRIVFSNLSDYQICTSVIPVCRHFREVALSVVFRRLNDDGAVILGRDQMQWYNGLPTQLLKHSGITPKSLEFSLSYELRVFHDDTLSLKEGRKMIETIEEMPMIERLSIQHRSFENFRTRPAPCSVLCSGVNNEQLQVTSLPTAACQRTYSAAVGEFIKGTLGPCRDHLKELEFGAV